MAEISPSSYTDRRGQPFAIRTAHPDDAGEALEYIRSVAAETENFVIEPDEFPSTLEEEREWIQDHVDDPGKLLLFAESEGDIIGSLSFEPGPFRRISHRGTLGISVAAHWRGRGVGTALLESLLRWAESQREIEKVCLDVFATNSGAIHLYRKLGFVEEGRRVKDIRRGPSDYVDTLVMARYVT